MGKPTLDLKKRWYERERAPASPDSLVALSMEAHRRKISYGQLVSSTTGLERFEIVEAYKRERKRKGSRRKEDRPG